MKKELLDLAKELTNLAYQVEELQAELSEYKKIHALQSKALTFCVGEMSMTFDQILEAASTQEKAALEMADNMPTAEEVEELKAEDGLTDDQKQHYYNQSPLHNPQFRIYDETC